MLDQAGSPLWQNDWVDGGEKRSFYCLTLTVLLSLSPLTPSPSGLAK